MYNRNLLMCRPDYFRIVYKINPWMHLTQQPDQSAVPAEYDAFIAAHRAAGRTLHFIDPDPEFPDMTFTANHALVRGKKAVLASLPSERAGEVPHTQRWLEAHSYEIIECPYLFSGQGDALPTGTGAVLKGRGWRSDPRSDALVADALGYEVIPLQTVSNRWYDLDLTIGVLRPGLLAVCLEALDKTSQDRLRARADLELIPVSLDEAKAFALNLVSDGSTVTLPQGAPQLERTLRNRGFEVIPLSITQLKLAGGGVRCTALALDAH